MIARSPADFIYIGYPKAASTFVGLFLKQHPQVTTHRLQLEPFSAASIADIKPARDENPDPGKVHVRINEKIAESICVVGDTVGWHKYKFVPDSWERLEGSVLLDANESAKRLHKAFPSANILLTIREQVDWLHSSYKFFMPRLPSWRRSFADFCKTPRGMAYLKAGYFDQTIEAYANAFGADRILVLRYEDIGKAPENFVSQLCAYLGIANQPLPKMRANEGSSAKDARIRRVIPIIDRLPSNVRKAGKKLASLLPIRNDVMFSDEEIKMIRKLYAKSNERTDKLVARLTR